ncbi:glycosyltransferase family 2 protein [Kiritimatiella glycovorans]|uniref:Putative dolichol-P-glucose synthetase n=1 Tax=Kiritimatiella glycovorans TaxID=1307763 RepID=A0A0G3EDL4_9BACT|nr:glycosyltransferase family 2 protein [Kiritimatiella glycovorans]AKJ63482.1 putative dolichol-P-glucose synthetase [Kiritimatiella glycovorans]
MTEAEKKDLELTILMPCLNEAETIGTCVRKAVRYLRESGLKGEVLVSDNGSGDGSPEQAAEAGARVIRADRRGYGYALRAGILAARGRFIIMGDADDSYDFSALDAFVHQLRAGYDVVVGNRFRGGIERRAMPLLHRYLGNPVLSFLGRLFFRCRIRDFHCGLRGFRRDAVDRLDLQTTGMEFASELIVKAALAGLSIAEVPTTLSRDGRSGRPHLRSWRDGWRHLRFLLMFAPNWLFLVPGSLLCVAGLLIFALVLPAPLVVGDVMFDVHTLVIGMGALLAGSEVLIFFWLARQYMTRVGLLTARPRRSRLRPDWEQVLLCGLLLAAAGAVVMAYAVCRWGMASFGDLNYTWMMRLVIPGVSMFSLGIQVATGAFLSGVIHLKTGRIDTEGASP